MFGETFHSQNCFLVILLYWKVTFLTISIKMLSRPTSLKVLSHCS